MANGSAIEIGDATTFRAPNPGELQLGLNDNFVSDNTGQWKATVRVSSAPETPGSTPPATPKKSSNTGIFVLIGVAVLVLLLLLLLFSRLAARRRREAADLATEAAELPEPAVAAVAGGGVASVLVDEPPPVPLTPFAAPEPESIDVNIFEVEFSNGLTMRVGYNHFPEGTELRWRVTQNRVPAASGQLRHQRAAGARTTSRPSRSA